MDSVTLNPVRPVVEARIRGVAEDHRDIREGHTGFAKCVNYSRVS